MTNHEMNSAFRMGGIITVIMPIVFVLAFAAILTVIIIAIVKGATHSSSSTTSTNATNINKQNSKPDNYICEYCGSVVDGVEKECQNCGAKK